MDCKEFYFKGKEDLDIHVYKCTSKIVNPKPVVQIAHGMSETAIRYEEFAKKLTENGYIVYINDHRGHGLTAKTIDNVGYLADKDGFRCLVEDMNTLTNIIKEENPDLPIYLFGHSMGSFASQRYIMEYGNQLDGLILSGSNGKHGEILKVGEFLSNYICKKHGRRHRSKTLDNLIFGGNNKKFKSSKTDFDWLSRYEKEVQKYIDDSFCGVLFTCGFLYDFIKGLQEIENPQNLKKVPLDLPIYIMSGDRDPIGKDGKGVLRLRDRYINLGVKNVSCKLYEGGRHEMLNEINKEEVMKDIIKKKEIKGILGSLLLIVLSVFLMLKPIEIIGTLIKVIGMILLICGVFDFTNYFVNKKEESLFDYGLVKGIIEITIGVLFIFKYDLLINLFPCILGLIIVFINIFKLQTAISLKEFESNYMTGVIISSLSIILGLVIVINPFETLEVVIIVSGAVLLISELSNIIYSISVLKFFKKTDKVVKDIVTKEEK